MPPCEALSQVSFSVIKTPNNDSNKGLRLLHSATLYAKKLPSCLRAMENVGSITSRCSGK